MSDSDPIRSVCVYCGSAPGSDPQHKAIAEALGALMAREGVRLVYGGGGLGLMGALARSVIENGGDVVGVIPDFLRNKEQMLQEVKNLIVTPDMHTRKRIMFEHADAFVALPGGIGTLEELVEQMTWTQLGRHEKPILLLDVGGFWRPLLDLLAHMRASGFILRHLEVRPLVAERVEDVLPMLRSDALAPKPDRRPLDPRL